MDKKDIILLKSRQTGKSTWMAEYAALHYIEIDNKIKREIRNKKLKTIINGNTTLQHDRERI